MYSTPPWRYQNLYAVARKPANDKDLMPKNPKNKIAIQAKTCMYKDRVISDYSVFKFLFK